MAIELRGRMEAVLGVVVPTIEILRGPSLSELATRILAQQAASPASENAEPLEEGPVPLSQGQAAQWLLHRLAPDNPAYHVSFAARVFGGLALARLEVALAQLVARHPALRSGYGRFEGLLSQRPDPAMAAEVIQVEAQGWEDHRLAAALRADYVRPFDLEAGPLLRVSLYELAPGEQVLLIVLHHIACDGWSLWVLLRDLDALLSGRGDSLPRLSAGPAAVVRAEQQKLAGPQGETLWNYWQKQLADLPPPLELPGDRRRPAIARIEGASVGFLIEAELADKLRILAKSRGATLFVVVLSAFEVLLQRLSGQEEFILGTPVAGRGDPAFAEMVSTFVNPLALRLDLSGNPSFATLIERSRATLLDALDHQDMPFPLLVEKLKLPRDPSRSALFQVDFAWQRPHQGEALIGLMAGGDSAARVEWGGVALAPYELAQQEGQFDLVLEIAETPGRLPATFKYNAALFDRTRIEGWIGQFLTLLAALAEAPDLVPELVIDRLPLAHDPVAELARGLGLPPGKAGASLLDRILSVNPAAPAVICGDAHLTYGALLGQARALAGRLTPGGRVGLYAERSTGMIVGMLGILLSGSAYVPLDPAYPVERLRLMIEDAGLAAIVATPGSEASFSANFGGLPLLLTEGNGAIAATDLPAIAATDVAYVIYTSGSTGQPKGVLVSHGNLAASTAARLDYYDQVPERFLLLSSIAFDSSIAGLFWTLAAGGTLVLPSGDLARDPLRLVEEIRQHKVTSTLAIPSLYAAALRHGNPADLASLCTVIVAGEPCPPDLVAAHFATFPTVALYNEYGPTEATVWASVHACRPEDAAGPVPIGRPIPGSHIVIGDAAGQPVPVGVVGELLVGGPGVALGYLNRPELTASAFIQDAEGARSYRTGDRARWRADGLIEFLGRRDEQIKLRGFRIELGEIEAVLRRLPGVREAAVILRDAPGGGQLAAYVVAEEGLDLLAELRRLLPQHMVPVSLTRLTALPLTVNGKLDRRALPAPLPPVARSANPAEELQGEIEPVIAAIWRDLLGVQPGRQDGFFDLGGHSLLLVEAHARLAARFGEGLTIVDLFAHPTVAALARHLEQGHLEQGQASAQTLPPQAERTARRGANDAALATQRADRRRARQGLV